MIPWFHVTLLSVQCVLGTEVHMAFIVEMAGGVEGARRLFCCGATVWGQILQLARGNGWRPLGTSPDPIWKHVSDKYGTFSGNYECDDCGKIISTPDAAALADALERASKHPLPAFPRGPVLLREGMTAQEYRLSNAVLDAAFLPELVAFFRKGEFSFFWDD
jgi:hypothetical protein